MAVPVEHSGCLSLLQCACSSYFPLHRQADTRYVTIRLITAVIAYLLYSPPRRLRRSISKILKNHPSLLRWRVGENVLVRWAREEIDLDEDDPMLITDDEISRFLDEEEGIPLKPSPRKGGITSYGTT